MSLPATLNVLGLVPGVALIIVAALLTEASIEMLVRFSKPGSVFSKGRCFWENRQVFEDVLSGTTSSGVHHAGVLEEWCGEQWWTGRAFVLLLITVVVFVPLICFKRIDSLRITSAISIALAVLFLVVLIGITVYKLVRESIETPKCSHNREGARRFCAAVVRTSVALCCTVYVMTGLFGFLLFGNSTLSDLLSNFDAYLGIPHSSFFNNLPLVDNKRFALLSAGLVGITLLGAIFIPNIWVAFEFTGATVGNLIAFIFPACISLKDRHGISTKKDKIVSVFMI
ncbi:Amino acid transporter, transmembrane domain containing protein [Parasponia andersonii]|uniref:Amino acid transporter, transmembrane domain containing protein n=1 Tax=Parasponia andersonii TaxID=3476 RepID=A0A2P5CAJ3_PARAD|nr:Amino acid transporter, transmembrane domain containing protein [Parasponia andersonii]